MNSSLNICHSKLFLFSALAAFVSLNVKHAHMQSQNGERRRPGIWNGCLEAVFVIFVGANWAGSGRKNNIDTDRAIKLYDNHFTPKIYEKIVEARIRTHG